MTLVNHDRLISARMRHLSSGPLRELKDLIDGSELGSRTDKCKALVDQALVELDQFAKSLRPPEEPISRGQSPVRLRVLPRFLEAILDGRKTFEIRQTHPPLPRVRGRELGSNIAEDRSFQVGDILHLIAYDCPPGQEYLEPSILGEAQIRVTYIARASDWTQIAEGFPDLIIMGFELLSDGSDDGASKEGS